MRNAQQYLELVRNRGERGLELKRVYRNLQNKELFLMAYAKLYKKYYHQLNNGLKAIIVKVEREDKDPLITRFGAKPIRFDRGAILDDPILQSRPARNDLVKRLLANQCELCGSTENINVHHIRKLKNLKQRYAGRPDPPQWVVRMIEKQRKTLVVCGQCHQAIHTGTYDGSKLN